MLNWIKETFLSHRIERQRREQRRVLTIRTIAEYCDKPNAAALANKAIEEGWSWERYEEELENQK